MAFNATIDNVQEDIESDLSPELAHQKPVEQPPESNPAPAKKVKSKYTRCIYCGTRNGAEELTCDSCGGELPIEEEE